MFQTYTVAELAEKIGASVQGDAGCTISKVSSLHAAKRGSVAFLSGRKRKHLEALAKTGASAVLIEPALVHACPTTAMIVSDPKKGILHVLNLLYPRPEFCAGIHPTAILGARCHVHATAHIGPHVVLGSEVTIGPRTVIGAGTCVGDRSSIGEDGLLYPNVTIYADTIIGHRVILHSGAVIGADGFGLLLNEKKQWNKIPQVGCVVIGDDVEIGANSTIDRGALEETTIGNGVKIDNLVMVAHNARVGDHTAIAGCAGIAGSTQVGAHCMIGPGAGIGGHINIADGAILTGMAMVEKSIDKAGIYSSGTGMQPNRQWHKSVIWFRRLEELVERVKKLERSQDERDRAK